MLIENVIVLDEKKNIKPFSPQFTCQSQNEVR